MPWERQYSSESRHPSDPTPSPYTCNFLVLQVGAPPKSSVQAHKLKRVGADILLSLLETVSRTYPPDCESLCEAGTVVIHCRSFDHTSGITRL